MVDVVGGTVLIGSSGFFAPQAKSNLETEELRLCGTESCFVGVFGASPKVYWFLVNFLITTRKLRINVSIPGRQSWIVWTWTF